MSTVEISGQPLEMVPTDHQMEEHAIEEKFWTKNNTFRFSAFAGISSFLLPWFVYGDYSATLLNSLGGTNVGLAIGGLVYLLCLGAALIAEEAQMYSLMGQVGALMLILSSVDNYSLGAGVWLAAISLIGMVATARYR